MAMLSVVATPIGNLSDITERALATLRAADIILAEDTRVIYKLLERYGIEKETMSYHGHSGDGKIERIMELLKEGKHCVLVSDAGTPGVNDPGSYLVKRILEELPDTRIVPIPGPNAAIAALSVSGFHSDEFIYLGFPPHKKGRQTFFKRIAEIDSAIVFYESKHRILKALQELKDVSLIENRPIMVARELTKQFETIYRGTVSEVQEQLKEVLGEFVIVIAPK